MSDGHLAPYHLERLQRDELDPAAAAAARAHLAGCEACQASERELAAHRLEFERAVLPRMAPQLRARLERPGPQRRWVWALAAALPAMVVVFALSRRAPVPHPEGDLLTKGGGEMIVFRRRGDAVRALVPGETVRPGDALRFRLAPGEFSYAMIGSVDGAGKATIYVPFGGEASAPVPRGGSWESLDSVVLDASPGPERLFALFSRQPLAARTVTEALAALGRRGPAAIRSADHLEVPADGQVSVLFEKEPP